MNTVSTSSNNALSSVSVLGFSRSATANSTSNGLKTPALSGFRTSVEEIVADELADGKLRRVMPEWQGKPIPVYAITETRLLPAKTQRFIEFLRDRLAQRG